MGMSYKTSLKPQLSKNIAYVGSFKHFFCSNDFTMYFALSLIPLLTQVWQLSTWDKLDFWHSDMGTGRDADTTGRGNLNRWTSFNIKLQDLGIIPWDKEMLHATFTSLLCLCLLDFLKQFDDDFQKYWQTVNYLLPSVHITGHLNNSFLNSQLCEMLEDGRLFFSSPEC